MRQLAVSAIGVDRPGIVAAVTGVLVGHGCNLEDTSMSILRGHFAMTLVVSAPDGTEAPELEGALTAATSAARARRRGPSARRGRGRVADR